MTDLQIKYFMKAAQRLNFSEAAKELFITQPALSQQITAIESELNMQLFIRDRNKLRLTPAAMVLLKELPACSAHFREVISHARMASEGYTGSLRLGVLEGQILPPNFRAALGSFREHSANIHIDLCSASFGRLLQRLNDQELDVILTTIFNVSGSGGCRWVRTDPNVCAILAAVTSPAAKKEVRDWTDLRDETLVLVDTEDCAKVKELVVMDCKRAGFTPQLLLAPSLNDQMLWIDAGLGVGVINADSYVCANPNVRCLQKIPISDNYFVVAWHKDNANSAIPLFTDYISDYIRTRQLLH